MFREIEFTIGLPPCQNNIELIDFYSHRWLKVVLIVLNFVWVLSYSRFQQKLQPR
jgi:hypothetical protein